MEVEAIDKGGNFIGWLYVDGVNLSLALVEEGLAKVHFTAERSVHYSKMVAAEDNAKTKKLKVNSERVSKWDIQYDGSLTLCMLDKFSCFCCHLLTFFKIIFFKIFFQERYQWFEQFGSNQDRHSVSPDLDPN